MLDVTRDYKTRDGSTVKNLYVSGSYYWGGVYHIHGGLIGNYQFGIDGKCPGFPHFDLSLGDVNQISLDKLCDRLDDLCTQVVRSLTKTDYGPSKEAYNVLYNAMLRIIWDKDATDLSPEYYRQIAQQAIIECGTK